MAGYDNAVALAKRLIEKKGRTVTLRQGISPAPTDPDAPWRVGAPVEITKRVKAVFLHYSQKEVDGSRVRATDEKVLVAAGSLGSFVPAVGTAILDGARTLRVESVEVVRPGDDAVVYELQARQ